MQAMQEIMKKNDKRGIAEPSNSVWNAPATLTKKKHRAVETLASKDGA
jgi:hypothetical protein